MIATIIILGIAFYWMLRETDYLRVKLLVGPYHAPIVYEYEDWETIEARLKNLPRKAMPDYIVMPDNYPPLCGWDWLKNRQHAIPLNKIQLDFGTRRYDMTVNDPDKLKDIIKVNVQRNTPKMLGGKKRKPFNYGMLNPHWVAARLEELEYTPEPEKVLQEV